MSPGKSVLQKIILDLFLERSILFRLLGSKTVLMLSCDNSMSKEVTEVESATSTGVTESRILTFYVTAFVYCGNNVKVKLKAWTEILRVHIWEKITVDNWEWPNRRAHVWHLIIHIIIYISIPFLSKFFVITIIIIPQSKPVGKGEAISRGRNWCKEIIYIVQGIFT